MRVPGGAFPEAAKAEHEHMRKPDGSKYAAFDSRAKALAEMRTAVNDHEGAIAQLQQEVSALPFPFGGPG